MKIFPMVISSLGSVDALLLAAYLPGILEDRAELDFQGFALAAEALAENIDFDRLLRSWTDELAPNQGTADEKVQDGEKRDNANDRGEISGETSHTPSFFVPQLRLRV
jgi:hypothetical protein